MMMMMNDYGRDLQEPVLVGVTLLVIYNRLGILVNVNHVCSAWLIN